MKVIHLTNGGETIVDDHQHEPLAQFNWQLSPQGYAYRCQSRKTFLMHRIIVEALNGEIVDHINRDKLDNQDSNLRRVGRSENAINASMRKTNTSGFRHVTRRKDTGKWHAQVTRHNRNHNLGSFPTPELASQAAEHFIKTGE